MIYLQLQLVVAAPAGVGEGGRVQVPHRLAFVAFEEVAVVPRFLGLLLRFGLILERFRLVESFF